MHRLPFSLFLLRLSIFVVMFISVVNKFINPGDTAAVWARYYMVNNLNELMVYVIGLVQGFFVLAFLLGVKKGVSYFVVLFMQVAFVAATYTQYLHPWSVNGRWFDAWVVLMACLALYILRDSDTFASTNIR